MTLKDQALKMLENKHAELLKGDTLHNTKRLSAQNLSNSHSSSKRSHPELNEHSPKASSRSVLRNDVSTRNEVGSTQPTQETLRRENESKSNLRRERAVRKYQKAVVVIQRAIRRFIKNKRRKKGISSSPMLGKESISDVRLRKENIFTPKKESFTDRETTHSGMFKEYL